MSEQAKILRWLLNMAIQRGLFQDAKSVEKVSMTIDYFVACEGDLKQTSRHCEQLEKELRAAKRDIKEIDPHS